MSKKTQDETLAEICEELHQIKDILEMMMEEKEHGDIEER